MSQFHPTNVTVDPPPTPDYFGAAVLQALSRPIGAPLAWGVVKSMFWAVATFGVWPLVTLVGNFRAFCTAEQQQFLHLAQWLRQNSHHPLTRQLEAEANDLTPRWWLSALPLLIVLVTGAAIAALVADAPRNAIDALMAGTYGYGERYVLDYRVREFRGAGEVFATWFWGLGFAYLCHFSQVLLRAGDVKRFVARFSQVAQAEGVHRVKADSLGLGVRPLWALAGVGMWLLNAPWGVVAMLAGGAQRRYINGTSRTTRADVAHRLRAMMVRRRPGGSSASAAVAAVDAGVPIPVYLRGRCVEDKCRAEIPRGVNYCPRCGTRQKAQINRVA